MEIIKILKRLIMQRSSRKKALSEMRGARQQGAGAGLSARSESPPKGPAHFIPSPKRR
jgi:hypothetical protein